jgi:hypothetical protein
MKYLILGLTMFIVALMTMMGVTQRVVTFDDPLLEIWFTTFMFLGAFLCVLSIDFKSKKNEKRSNR